MCLYSLHDNIPLEEVSPGVYSGCKILKYSDCMNRYTTPMWPSSYFNLGEWVRDSEIWTIDAIGTGESYMCGFHTFTSRAEAIRALRVARYISDSGRIYGLRLARVHLQDITARGLDESSSLSVVAREMKVVSVSPIPNLKVVDRKVSETVRSAIRHYRHRLLSGMDMSYCRLESPSVRVHKDGHFVFNSKHLVRLV